MSDFTYLEIETTDGEVSEALWNLNNSPDAVGIEMTELMKKSDQLERVYEIMLLAKTGVEIAGGLGGVILIIKKLAQKNGKHIKVRLRASHATADLIKGQLRKTNVSIDIESRPVPPTIEAAMDEHYAQAHRMIDEHLAKMKSGVPPE